MNAAPPKVVLVGARSPTNTGLIEAFRRLGSPAELAPPDHVPTISPADDILVGRLRPGSPDAVGPALGALTALERAGVRVLNGAASLRVCHDKLATATCLIAAGIPHPRTAVLDGRTAPRVEPPLVLKPRFGEGGEHVYLCVDRAELEETVASLAHQPWLRRQGAVVQELVPTGGQDLRVIVAGGRIVGGIRRMAPPGSWRTGAGGGRCRTTVNREASALALAAAAAVGGDLVGVDLVALWNGQTVIDVNGCVDFTREYAADRDAFTQAATALLEVVERGSENTS